MNTARAVEFAETAAMRAKPDGKANPAGEAGWFLERERVRKGYNLADAHQATEIALHHIIAIERGEFQRLPAKYALPLIGHYANWLGFDPEPLCDHISSLLPRRPVLVVDEADAEPRAQRRARPNFSQPDTKVIAVSLAAIIAIFGFTGWKIYDGAHLTPAPQAAAEPAPAPAPVQPAPVTVNKQASLPAPVAPPGNMLGQPAALEGLDELINKTVEAVDATGIGPRSEPTPLPGLANPGVAITTLQDGRRIFGADDQARLTLEALDTITLRVEDSLGKVVASMTLNKGDQYRVPARDDLQVITRDGGLIAYAIDGARRGTLGKPGDILVGEPLSLTALGG